MNIVDELLDFFNTDERIDRDDIEALMNRAAEHIEILEARCRGLEQQIENLPSKRFGKGE